MPPPSHRVAGQYTRGYLPHIRVEGRRYFVTFRLDGTLPQEVLHNLQGERDELIRKAGREGHQLSWDEQKRLFDLYSERIESHLDAGRGDCWLKNPRVAEIVASALRFFVNSRYALGAWVVMPNHVHVLVRPLGEHTLDSVVKSWKGFSAREANKILERTGEVFWAHEYYDHWLRDEDEKARLTAYVYDNPVKAGLCARPEDWLWSSAHPRWARGVGTGGSKASQPADTNVGVTGEGAPP